LELRGEAEGPVFLGVEERLLAEPVPRQEEAAPAAVPDAEGEHPAQAADALRSPLLVGVDDRLGVGARAEAVPESLQFGAQRLEVVDLAVEGDPDAAVFVGERLP